MLPCQVMFESYTVKWNGRCLCSECWPNGSRRVKQAFMKMKMHDKSCYWSMPPPQVSIMEEHVTIYCSAWELKGVRVNSIPKVLLSNKNAINCEVNKDCLRVCLGSPSGNSILHFVCILVSLKNNKQQQQSKQTTLSTHSPKKPKKTPNQPNKKTHHQKNPWYRDWTAVAWSFWSTCIQESNA